MTQGESADALRVLANLRQISFTTFKRFERFTVSCRAANVLVGPNNAGKSSILDALRILYGAHRYARRLRPRLINVRDGQAIGYEIPSSSIPIGTSIGTKFSAKSLGAPSPTKEKSRVERTALKSPKNARRHSIVFGVT
jgi:hypothetical protein